MEKDKPYKLDINNLICFNFYSGSRALEQLFRTIVGERMTMQKSFILSYLYDEKKTMKQVSEYLNLDSSAVSTLVDRMFKKGIIVRNNSKEDRLIVFVTLTDAGKKLKNDIDEKITEFMQTSSQGISDIEQNKLLEIVTKVKTNHNNLTAKRAQGI